MHFNRTNDYGLVYQILTMKDVYEHLGDDFLPAAEDFVVNKHSDAWYVTACHAGGFVGLFSLFPKNRVCFEVHACMYPEARARDKAEAAREFPQWVKEQSDCKRLVAEIPRSNKPALHFAVHGGMRVVGVHRQAFQKYGRLEDLLILGMSL